MSLAKIGVRQGPTEVVADLYCAWAEAGRTEPFGQYVINNATKAVAEPAGAEFAELWYAETSAYAYEVACDLFKRGLLQYVAPNTFGAISILKRGKNAI